MEERRLLLAVALVSGISCSSYRELRIFPLETVLEGDGGALQVQWEDDYAFVETTVLDCIEACVKGAESPRTN